MKSVEAMGDRSPGIVQKIPASALYARNGGMILDVTKEPFNAKGDGVTDDTEALCKAMTFVRDHTPIAQIDGHCFCTQRKDWNWTIYLPDGIYLVSGTVSQNWPAKAFNILHTWDDCRYFTVASPEEEQAIHDRTVDYVPHLHDDPKLLAVDDNSSSYIRGQYNSMQIYAEANWTIRLIGESRERTIIRLKDHAAGFDASEPKPVVANVLLQRGSNVNIGNFVENLTIDTGLGNPGAAAMRWNCSNYGAVRNTKLISRDEGTVGLLMDRNNATGHFRDLVISGFRTGIQLNAGRETMIVMEHATIDASGTGIDLGESRCGGGGDSLNCQKMILRAPRPLICRRAGQAILLDSELQVTGGGNAPGIDVRKDAFLLARRVKISGTERTVVTPETTLHDAFLRDFFSKEAFHSNAAWTEVPVREVPVVNGNPDPSAWALVDDYGAKGDGTSDDTEAIQKALDSGKEKIFFGHRCYMLNGSVTIPANVREIDGMNTCVFRHSGKAFHTNALFRVAEASAEPLLIRRFLSAGGVFADHDAPRPLVLEDVFVEFNHGRAGWGVDGRINVKSADQNSEIWRCYRNPDTKGPRRVVFLNNCIMPTGDLEDTSLAIENADFYGRMIDSEHVGGGLYTFRNCNAWIFGFKSENTNTLAGAYQGTKMEILGGSLLEFTQKQGPLMISEDSELSSVIYLWHMRIVPPELLQKDGKNLLPGSELKALESEDAAVYLLQ